MDDAIKFSTGLEDVYKQVSNNHLFCRQVLSTAIIHMHCSNLDAALEKLSLVPGSEAEGLISGMVQALQEQDADTLKYIQASSEISYLDNVIVKLAKALKLPEKQADLAELIEEEGFL